MDGKKQKVEHGDESSGLGAEPQGSQVGLMGMRSPKCGERKV